MVETVNFTDETWLTDNGAFHTKDLKVVERLRRVGDTIQYQAVAHDPAVLAEPWVMRPRELSRSTVELEESPRCEERDLEHMVDGSSHENPRVSADPRCNSVSSVVALFDTQRWAA